MKPPEWISRATFPVWRACEITNAPQRWIVNATGPWIAASHKALPPSLTATQAAPGKWEVVQAGAAELLARGRYRPTRLLRGQRGSEGAMGNPTLAGARVVVLDTALVPLPIAEADLGLPWNWRMGPAARSVSYAALAFTPAGRDLVTFAPVHLVQPSRTARSPGDLAIRWTRRSRTLVADAWEEVEVPLAEDLEDYDVLILDGAVVKRTLTGTTTSVPDRTRTAPPEGPVDGSRHLVALGATGLWAGWDLNLAFRVDGAWMRLVSRTGSKPSRRSWSGMAAPGRWWGSRRMFRTPCSAC
jgi:hypothetical protein